jgi:hypothetical protein
VRSGNRTLTSCTDAQLDVELVESIWRASAKPN